MKFIRILFLLMAYQCYFFSTAQGLEISKQMKSGAKKLAAICMKETGATEDLFHEAKETSKLPSDNRSKCFIHCVLDKIGLIDSENIVHLDNLFEVMPPDFHPIIEQLHTTCGTQSGADGCETSYLTTECYIKTNPVILKLLFVSLSD
ncbi:general odorant-binding protein 69a [Eurosta solidaginis]|uniref:general odorant-binding protein 69a n=1 Tax=Eurosta solidaginis TaxID=178769 RepID=UPI00353126E2